MCQILNIWFGLALYLTYQRISHPHKLEIGEPMLQKYGSYAYNKPLLEKEEKCKSKEEPKKCP